MADAVGGEPVRLGYGEARIGLVRAVAEAILKVWAGEGTDFDKGWPLFEPSARAAIEAYERHKLDEVIDG